MLKVNIIADTVKYGSRLTTMQLRYPRFIHPQMLTHRLFARNARSSRAVPIATMIQEVLTDSAMPEEWGKNQKGMVAGEEIEKKEEAKALWVEASQLMISYAEALQKLGVHKQVANRLLESFMYIDVVFTATDSYIDRGEVINPWHHFFNLRCAHDAAPTIQALSRAMATAYATSHPREDALHLPYVLEEEREGADLRSLLEWSAARCARISYKPHDASKSDTKKDYALCRKLILDGHHSPLEHAAVASQNRQYGVLNGWQSFRYILREEAWMKDYHK